MDYQTYYQQFQEEKRFLSQALSIEHWMTMQIIMELPLKKGMKILEVGAGCGAYSTTLAKLGYEVVAIEPVRRNVKVLKEQARDLPITVIHADHQALQHFEDGQFDVILCLGPMYHLHEQSQQELCLKEAWRVCRCALLCAFVNEEAVFVSEALYQANQSMLLSEDYERENMQIKDGVFVFFDPSEITALYRRLGISNDHLYAVDPFSEVKYDVINAFTDAQLDEWKRYIWKHRENPHYYGASNHLLMMSLK